MNQREITKELRVIATNTSPPSQEITYLPRMKAHFQQHYAIGSDIVVPYNYAWEIRSIQLEGVADTTFMPALEIRTMNGDLVYKCVGAQVDNGDAYLVVMAPGIASDGYALLAGVPNHFVSMGLPRRFVAEEGIIRFVKYESGAPGSESPAVRINYYLQRMEKL